MEQKPNIKKSYLEMTVSIGENTLTFLVDNAFVTDYNGTDLPHYRHVHPYYEVLFVKSGSLTIRCGTDSYTLESGETLLIAPDTLHIGQLNDLYTKLFAFGFLFRDSAGNALPGDKSMVKFGSNHETDFLMSRMAELYSPSLDFNRDLFGSYANTLFFFLKSKLETEKPVGKTSRPVRADDVFAEYELDRYLIDNFCRPITLDSVSKQLFMSVRQINRVVKRLYNKNFKQHIIELRAEEAASLLTHTDRKIEAISEAVGYASLFSFYRSFKEHFGATPNEYRHRSRQSE